MKKYFLSIIFILFIASASLAAVGASSWPPDGAKLCGDNYQSGYGLADGLPTKGMYLFVSQPSGTFGSAAFSGRFIHVNSDGTIAFDEEIDKYLPSDKSSSFQASGQSFKVAVLDTTSSSPSPIAAWVRKFNTSGSSTKEIYIEKFDTSGNYKWTNPVLVVSADPAVAGIQDYWVESDSNGGAVAVWNTSNYKIYARRVNSDGILSSPILVTTETTPIDRIMTVSGSADYFWVVWEVSRGGGEYAINVQKVLFNRVAAPSTTYTIVDKAHSLQLSGQTEQSICSDGNGGLVVTWSQIRPDGIQKKNVYAQRVDGNLNFYPALGDNGLAVFSVDSSDQANPVIDLIDSNNVMIACSSSEGTSSINVFGAKINISNFSGSGISWKKGLSTSGLATYPRLCPDGSGNAFVSYLDGRNEPNLSKLLGWFYYFQREIATSEWTANLDIYAKRINTLGSDMWSQGDIPLCRAQNIQFPRQVVNTETGKAVAYWIDVRDSASDPANIDGYTADQAQLAILANSSIYGAKISDASVPTITVNNISGIPYTSGMSIPQDAANTMEGTVQANGSSFSTTYSSLEISWDSGAAQSVAFSPVSLSLSNFSHEKTLANGTHAFAITAADDYGIPASFSGTVLATFDVVLVSNLQFAWAAQPVGYVTLFSQNSSWLNASAIGIVVQLDDGLSVLIPAGNIKLEKMISANSGIFSFVYPNAIPAGTHKVKITVTDKNNINAVLGTLTNPNVIAPAANIAAILPTIQNGQLILSMKTSANLAQTPFTVSIVAPNGATGVISSANAQIDTSTPGVTIVKWDISKNVFIGNLARGIYPLYTSMGDKTYLVISGQH